MALFLIMGTIFIPTGIRMYQTQVMYETADSLGASLRRAQAYAYAGRHGASFGLFISGSSYVLFEGESYASRNTDFDEQFSIPSSIEVAGMEEIVFAAASGAPSATGTIRLENNFKTSTIVVGNRTIAW
jgi:hypothetical protein